MRRNEIIPLVVLTLTVQAILAIAVIQKVDLSANTSALTALNHPDVDKFELASTVANLRAVQAQVYWSAVSSVVAVLGVIVTAAGLLFVAAQLRLSRQQLDKDRAYIHHNGMRWLSFGREGKTDHWGIFPRWINSGGTQAIDVELWYGADWIGIDELPTFSPVAGHKSTMRPGGEVEMAPVMLTPIEIEASGTGGRAFCIWGEATYRDVFAKEMIRKTRFCVKLLGYGGDPSLMWDQNDNPVRLDFANIGENWAN